MKFKDKHLVMRTKLKALPKSDITGNEQKTPLFTTISHTKLIGYSDVLTLWLQNLQFMKVGPSPSLRSKKTRDDRYFDAFLTA